MRFSCRTVFLVAICVSNIDILCLFCNRYLYYDYNNKEEKSCKCRFTSRSDFLTRNTEIQNGCKCNLMERATETNKVY